MCQILARELVRSRRAVNRLYENKAQISSVSMRLGEIIGTKRTIECLSKSAEVMKIVNDLMKAQELALTMQKFGKEMLKVEIMEERVNKTVDSALDSEDIEDEIEEEVDKVLAALGAETASRLPDAQRIKQDSISSPGQRQTIDEDINGDQEDTEEKRTRKRKEVVVPTHGGTGTGLPPVAAAMECAAKGLAGEPCAGGVADRWCGSCGAVAYCSRAHQIMHWRVHKEECERFAEQMRHIDLLSQFPFTFLEPPALNHEFPSARCFFLQTIKLHQKGLWKSECICGPDVASAKDLSIAAEWNLQSSLCPCTEPENPVPAVLTSWEDYYQWRSLPLHSPVAVLLHWPLTLYHCVQLSRLQTTRYDGHDTLCIHYLGPEKELLQLAVFGELRALFPGVQIHIELVGPEVPESRDGEVVNISRYACCSDESCCCKSCVGSEDLSCATVTLKLWKGFYHERCNDITKDSNPHLIVAPNAGVAAYPTWMPTIEIIRQMGIPAIFTDFCEEAARLASCCIGSITSQPLKIPVQVNPFRQPVAADNSALYLPCYSNCFVFGM